MPLDDVPVDFDPGLLIPADADELIRDAEDRIERFIIASRQSAPLPAFVASDFRMVYRTLDRVLDRRLATGRGFCEWGCGFGVVAGLASRLGLEACGIEIEHDLVHHGQRLLEDHGLDVPIVQGSFVPPGGDELVDAVAQQAWLKTGETPAYDELELEVDDFELIFAYPWPGEEELVDLLFERFAAAGALLLTYHGMNEMRLQRKA
ncbi:MAG: class I SAM-dependent methyltransferase [Planctomycetota bacterium]